MSGLQGLDQTPLGERHFLYREERAIQSFSYTARALGIHNKEAVL